MDSKRDEAEANELIRVGLINLYKAGEQHLVMMDEYMTNLRRLLCAIEVAVRREPFFVDPPDDPRPLPGTPLPHGADGAKGPGGGK